MNSEPNSPQREKLLLDNLSTRSRMLWNGVRAGIATTALSGITVLIGIHEASGAHAGGLDTPEKIGLAGLAGGLALAVSAATAYIPSSNRDYRAAIEAAE